MSCPEGFENKSGDIPGWGSDLGGRLRLSRQECAIKCNEERNCLSFEQSETKKLCNLNRIAEPTQGPYEDFAFCVKEKGKKIISNARGNLDESTLIQASHHTINHENQLI